MPITLEEFKKLPKPTKESRKAGRKVDWSKVHAEIHGSGVTVREVLDIVNAKYLVNGAQSVSRIRVKKYLDKLVLDDKAVLAQDGQVFVYFVK